MSLHVLNVLNVIRNCRSELLWKTPVIMTNLGLQCGKDTEDAMWERHRECAAPTLLLSKVNVLVILHRFRKPGLIFSKSKFECRVRKDFKQHG